MLGLILLSQNADTVKSDGVSREETFRFLAGQCLLGSTAYPYAAYLWVLSISEDDNNRYRYASCAACMTPMACLTANAAFALSTNIKKPLAVSSFTGAVDGMIWSVLLIANIAVHAEKWDSKLYSTLFLLGLSGGNAAGYVAGLQGGSDGAYVLKTVSAVQLPYAYSQLKRLIFGRWVFDVTSEGAFKAELEIIMGLSIAGGLGTFALTHNDYSITDGDALFIASNIAKGAFVLEAPIRLLYSLTHEDFGGASLFGYYNRHPVFERVGGFANLAGMALGGYLSYKIVKKKDFSLLEGLIYSVVPTLAYWAALAPGYIIGADYYRISPVVQATFDVGASFLIYQLIEKF
ncbi:MAG: hypothetical protein ACO2O5_14180 [Candidatus Caldipriscus sp.]